MVTKESALEWSAALQALLPTIEALRSAGVQEFRLGDLQLVLLPPAPPLPDAPPPLSVRDVLDEYYEAAREHRRQES